MIYRVTKKQRRKRTDDPWLRGAQDYVLERISTNPWRLGTKEHAQYDAGFACARRQLREESKCHNPKTRTISPHGGTDTFPTEPSSNTPNPQEKPYNSSSNGLSSRPATKGLSATPLPSTPGFPSHYAKSSTTANHQRIDVNHLTHKKEQKP